MRRRVTERWCEGGSRIEKVGCGSFACGPRRRRGRPSPRPSPPWPHCAASAPCTRADQDLLLTSSSDRPLLRRLLFPARSFLRGAFSTALPYELGGERIVLLLVPTRAGGGRSSDHAGYRRSGGAIGELRAAAPDGLRFELRTATTFGRSRPLATVTTDAPLTADQTDALRFNPWTTGPGIRPSGWLNLLRDAAYRASQRGPEHVGFSRRVGPPWSRSRDQSPVWRGLVPATPEAFTSTSRAKPPPCAAGDPLRGAFP
jgi:hypothetical protein